MPDSTPPFDLLPELMLSLRSFGSRRRVANQQSALDDEEARFFAPMLDARRAAGDAVTRLQVVAAFDTRRLVALLDATVRAFATERFKTRPPARRAFEAELFEIVEPLRVSLRELRDRAEVVTSAREESARHDLFASWLEQLRAAFHVADAIWPALAEALAAAPVVDAGKSRRGESQ